jgi:hypothetical protein
MKRYGLRWSAECERQGRLGGGERRWGMRMGRKIERPGLVGQR